GSSKGVAELFDTCIGGALNNGRNSLDGHQRRPDSYLPNDRFTNSKTPSATPNRRSSSRSASAEKSASSAGRIAFDQAKEATRRPPIRATTSAVPRPLRSLVTTAARSPVGP